MYRFIYVEMSNNASSCPDPGQPSKTAAIAKAAAYLLIFVVSTLGNLLVIVVVGRNRRIRSAAINQLIASMALADLLTSLFNMTVELWIHTKEATGQQVVWFDGVMGVALCKMIVFVQAVSMACSVSTLTAIAVNRFYAVFYPLKMGFSKSLSSVIIGFIWLVSCATASPMLYAMKVIEVEGNLQCVEQWTPAFDDESSHKNFSLLLLSLFYALPLAVITVLYTAVVRKVWRRQVPGNITAPNQLVELATKKRVLRMLITVMIVFGLCWLPYYTYLLLSVVVYSPVRCRPSVSVMFIGLFLGHTNSAINPCIYAIFNKEYRSGFLSVHRACLPTLHGSRVPRNFNQSSIRVTQFGTEEMTMREHWKRPSAIQKDLR